jgi:arabinofuranosyltransferase
VEHEEYDRDTQQEEMPMKPRSMHAIASIIFYLSIVCIIVSILGQFYIFRDYTVDDTFITLRYARNFIQGHGLVFNAGEKVEGFSNPLLLFLTIAVSYAGVPYLAAVKLIGALSYLVCLVISIRFIMRRISGFTLPLLIALVFSSFPVIFFSITGLETVLFALLLLLSFVAVVNNGYELDWKLVFICVLCMLCRPEGLMVSVIVYGSILLSRRNQGTPIFRRNDLSYIASFLVLVIAILIVRYLYYGSFLPNTFYAKLPWTQGSRVFWLLRGFDDMAYFFGFFGGAFGAFLLAIHLFHQGRWDYCYLSMIYLLFFAIFQKYAGGDWMIGARFMAPVAVIYGLGILRAATELTTRLAIEKERLTIACGVVAIILSVSNLLYAVDFKSNDDIYPGNVQTSIGLEEIGTWIDENIPENYRIQNWRIGAISYYCDNYVIDEWGLVSKPIARIRSSAPDAQRAGKLVKEYISKLDPEVRISSVSYAATVGDLSDDGKWKLVFKGANGKSMLGVWLRSDLAKSSQ